MKTFSIFNFILIIFSIAIVLTVSGCDKEDILNLGFTPDADLPTLFGIVTDANTNTVLDSVQISWFDDRDSLGVASVYTDNNGYYSIPGLNYGIYTFTLSLSEYANQQVDFSLQPLIPDNFVPGNATSVDDYIIDDYRPENNMSMYALDAGITGTVYKTINAENTAVADTATVKLQLSTSLLTYNATGVTPDVFTTTTNSLGVYSFANLPATPFAIISVLPHSDGSNNFNYASDSQPLYGGTTIASPNITVTLNQGVVEVVNNNIASGYVGISDNITFTFSHAMDSSSVEITLTTSGNNVSFDVIWIDAYNLVINPHDNLTAGSSYNISITGLSADNSTLSTSNSLTVEKSMELLWTNIEIGNGSNHSHFPVDSNIMLLFSKTPDLTNSDNLIELRNGGTLLEATVSVSGDTLIVDPAANLDWNSSTTLTYRVHSTTSGHFISDSNTFTTVSYDGIEFISSNTTIDGNSSTAHFANNANIELTFNMAPNLTNSSTDIKLHLGAYSATCAACVDIVVTATGNMVVINPAQDLLIGQTYTVSYTVFSSTVGDFVSATTGLQFTTVDNVIEQLYTNLNEYDENEFPTSSAIKILFSKTPSKIAPTDVDLLDVTNNDAVATTLTVSGDTLIITPNATLKADHVYSYTYRVYADAAADANADNLCTTGDDCVTTAAAVSFTTKRNYTTVPASVTTFTTGTSSVDFDTRTFEFTWTGVDYADGYYIYAKDNLHNPDYVRVSAILPDNDGQNLHSGSALLADYPQFDLFTDDGDGDNFPTDIQTPFAGITMSFMITASNDYGESAISNVLTFNDTIKAEVEVLTQTNDAANNFQGNKLALVENSNGTWNVNYITNATIGGFQFTVDNATITSASYESPITNLTPTTTSVIGIGEIPEGNGTLCELTLTGTPTGLSAIVVSNAEGTTFLDFDYEDIETPETKIVTITQSFNEYMDTSLSRTISMTENSATAGEGDINYVLPDSAVEYRWDSNGDQITITLTIPASKDARGDNITIPSTSLKDLSGNAIASSLVITLN